MRKWIVIAATCCIGVAFAASQPVPSAKADQQAAQAGKPQPSSAAPASPPSAVINPAPTNQTASAPQHRENEGRESGLWHGIKVWLLKLAEDPVALFTLVLAVYTVRLWKSTDKLWMEANDAGKTAKVAADAAKKAAEVAESALLSVERPYLFVNAREYRIDVDDSGVTGNPYQPFVIYSVENHGKLPGIIDAVQAEIIHAPDERLNPPLSVDAEDPLLMDRVIGAHDRRNPLVFKGSTLDPAVINSPNVTDREIFFWVVIHYHGPFTTGHETSGCWRVVHGDRLALLHYGHEQYNYTK